MSSFFDLVTRLQTTISNLNTLLTGNDSTTVNINGVNKNTISKEIKDRFFTLNIGQRYGLIAFSTKPELDAYTPTAEQQTASFKITSDPDSNNNGYYTWVIGSTYSKDTELVSSIIGLENTSDPISGAAVYNQVQVNTDLNTSDLSNVDIALGDTRQPIPEPPNLVSSVGNYVQATPIAGFGKLLQVNVYCGASGDIEVRVYDKIGDQFTKVESQLIAVTSGYNEITISLQYKSGQYVGVYQSSAILKYKASELSDDGGWYYGTGDSFTDASATATGRFGVSYLTFVRNKLSKLVDRVTANEEKTESITKELIVESQVLGYAEQSIPDGTNTADVNNWVQATPLVGVYEINFVRLYAQVNATVYIATYSRVGDDFTIIKSFAVDVVSGLNELPVELNVEDGQYVGFYSSQATVRYSSGAADDGGWYYGVGNSFTDISTTSSFRLHIAYFGARLNRITKVEERMSTLESEIANRPTSSVNLPFENMMIIGSGQSLMEGSQTGTSGTNPITVSQAYDNMCFQAKDGSANIIYPATVANSQAASSRGEWSGLSCAIHLREKLLNENNLSHQDIKSTIVIANEAQGGATLAEISKGTQRYNSGITKASNLAAITEQTAGVLAIIFMQGESDASSDPVYGASYKNALIQLASDYNADIKAATGQTLDVKLFSYQLTSIGRQTGLAHLAASEESDLIVLATPMYQFIYYDSLHVDSVSERLIGAYFAQAIKQTVLDGNEFAPLKPIHSSVLGNTVVLTFNKNGLEFDVTLISQQANNGFVVKNDSGISQAIVSLSTINSNQVKITLGSSPSNDWTIEYGVPAVGKGAYSGACGNLRDSAGIDNLFDDYPLHNWCVLFDWVL